jgi:hypothetical protein
MDGIADRGNLFDPVRDNRVSGKSLLTTHGPALAVMAWQDADFDASVRLGVIAGSVPSATAGFPIPGFAAVAKPAESSAPPPVTDAATEPEAMTAGSRADG